MHTNYYKSVKQLKSFKIIIVAPTCFALHKPSSGSSQPVLRWSYRYCGCICSIPTHSRKLLKMNVLAFETCWAKNKATPVGLSLFKYHICLFRNGKFVGMVQHVSDMVFFWKDVLGNVQVLVCSFIVTDTKDGSFRQVSSEMKEIMASIVLLRIVV